MADYLNWIKEGVDQESLTVYNFGYERPLPFPSISLTPDTTMSFNLQTSGMQTQSRWSSVVIGEKYLGRFEEIMTVVERIHEESQALPLTIYVETDDEIKTTNISSRVTPSLVHIPRTRSSQSFVTKMRCQVTSNKTHGILISKEISYKTYKEICSGKTKKVNLGYNLYDWFQVENNTLMPYPPFGTHLYDELA